MQEKPRICLVLIRASWAGCEATGDMAAELEEDTRRMVDRLEQNARVRSLWAIDSPESLEACRAALLAGDLDADLILLAAQTWTELSPLGQLVPALRAAGLPLVLWCYVPWRRTPRPVSPGEMLRGSGPVGALDALGVLRNLAIPFFFTFGAPDDPRLLQDLRIAGKAARVRQALRSARFGVLPGVCKAGRAAYVDPAELRADLGPSVEVIPPENALRAAAMISPGRIEDYLALLRGRYRVEAVSDAALAQSSRIALALEALSREHNLDVLCVSSRSDVLDTLPGLPPGLYPDLLAPGRALYQPECDLGAAAANFVLRALTGSPTLLLELWFWDEARNQVVGGHLGVQNPALSEAGGAWIGPDFFPCRSDDAAGAQLQFLARPGRVTLFQMRSSPTGWKAAAVTGVCLEGQPWVEGCPHAILRLDTPVDQFLHRLADAGASEHWILSYGSVLPELEAFCRMQNISLVTFTN